VIHKLNSYRNKFEVDIQRRACEFSALLQQGFEISSAALARIPVLESATKEQANKGTGVKVGNCFLN
jgi:hypothetical protein